MVTSIASPRKFLKDSVFKGVIGSPRRRCSSPRFGGEFDDGAAEDPMEMVQLGAERAKNVLILMSDAGGGHRASAEAIKDTFRLEFGDEYRVFVKDVWKEHAGWPLNDMERSYKFMVKHVQLWKVAFHTSYPRWVHCVCFAAIAAFYAD